MDAEQCLTWMHELGEQVIQYFHSVSEGERDYSRIRSLLEERHAVFLEWSSAASTVPPAGTSHALMREILEQNDEITRLLSGHRQVVQRRMERVAATRRFLRSSPILRREPRHIDIRG